MILILITSVINTCSNKLSYSKIRSKFSMEERFFQTKNTIQSIHEKITRPKTIMFIETSTIPKEYELFIKKNVDIYLNPDNPQILNNTTNCSKSLGEGSQTIYALQYLIDNNIECNHFIKISGRYFLSNKFDLDTYINNNIVVKPINNNKKNILTALYKLPGKNVNLLLDFLKENINQMQKCIGYEVLFAQFIQKFTNIIFIDIVGIKGYVSVCGSLYDG